MANFIVGSGFGSFPPFLPIPSTRGAEKCLRPPTPNLIDARAADSPNARTSCRRANYVTLPSTALQVVTKNKDAKGHKYTRLVPGLVNARPYAAAKTIDAAHQHRGGSSLSSFDSMRGCGTNIAPNPYTNSKETLKTTAALTGKKYKNEGAPVLRSQHQKSRFAKKGGNGHETRRDETATPKHQQNLRVQRLTSTVCTTPISNAERHTENCGYPTCFCMCSTRTQSVPVP